MSYATNQLSDRLVSLGLQKLFVLGRKFCGPLRNPVFEVAVQGLNVLIPLGQHPSVQLVDGCYSPDRDQHEAEASADNRWHDEKPALGPVAHDDKVLERRRCDHDCQARKHDARV